MSSNSNANGAGTQGTRGETNSVITSAAWDLRITRCEVAKGDLNELVMNYLIFEGYRDAAAHFLEESGTQPRVDLQTIEDRVAIRKAVMEGDVVQAMKLANELDPTMLDADRKLRFGLLKQRLLELVRRGETDEALAFAAERLAPEGAGDPRMLRQVEEAVTLLAFKDVSQCPLSGLLDLEQRQATAGRLNAAVLRSQQQEKGPLLPDLLRQLAHAQDALAERVEFPRIEGIRGGKSGSQAQGAGEGSDGDGPR